MTFSKGNVNTGSIAKAKIVGPDKDYVKVEYPTEYKDDKYFVEGAEREIASLERKLARAKKDLDTVSNWKFKKGDVVTVKNIGNGIVSGMNYRYEPTKQYDEEESGVFYVVVATQNGYLNVLPQDVMPYTVATKVLY